MCQTRAAEAGIMPATARGRNSHLSKWPPSCHRCGNGGWVTCWWAQGKRMRTKWRLKPKDFRTSICVNGHQAALPCTSLSSLPSRMLLQTERVTGRKARGLQMEEIGYKCQTFFFFFYLSLKQLEETNYKCQIFFSSLYKIKRRFLLKFCVAMMTPDSI